MKDKLKSIVTDLELDLKSCEKEADILNVKSKYLGKKSKLNYFLSQLKDMSVEEKKTNGPLLNQIKKELEKLVDEKLEQINNQENCEFDDTLPVELEIGSLHPITIIARDRKSVV